MFLLWPMLMPQLLGPEPSPGSDHLRSHLQSQLTHSHRKCPLSICRTESRVTEWVLEPDGPGLDSRLDPTGSPRPCFLTCKMEKLFPTSHVNEDKIKQSLESFGAVFSCKRWVI